MLQFLFTLSCSFFQVAMLQITYVIDFKWTFSMLSVLSCAEKFKLLPNCRVPIEERMHVYNV